MTNDDSIATDQSHLLEVNNKPAVNRQHGNSPGFSTRRRVPREIPFEDPSPQTRYYSNEQSKAQADLKIPGINKQ